MEYDMGCCDACPQELKDAESAAYRAVLRVKNLENAVKMAPPQEFDSLMDKLEAALEECRKATASVRMIRYLWVSKTLTDIKT